MSHNERGLRIDGAPVKRHDVVVEVLMRVEGSPNKDHARGHAEEVVRECLGERELWWTDARLLGRPNAKRATVAPDAEA